MTTTRPPDGFYYVEGIYNTRTARIELNNFLCPSCVARLVLTHDIWGHIADSSWVDGRLCDLCGKLDND